MSPLLSSSAPRWSILIPLVLSPIVISGAIVLLGCFIHGVGRAFGSTRPPTGIIAAMLILALLHAGYYLAPLLWLNGRTSLALWLMVPMALIAAIVGLSIVLQLMPAATESDSNVRFFYRVLAGGLIVGAAYITPIALFALQSPKE